MGGVDEVVAELALALKVDDMGVKVAGRDLVGGHIDADRDLLANEVGQNDVRIGAE